MTNGGDAAEQVVRLSLEGFEVAAKLSGAAAKNIAVLLVSVLKQEQKTKGKARLTNMIKSGKELKVFSIPNKDLKKFTEQAKRYGVLYCVLRDKNTKGDNVPIDIIARAEDASKIQRIVERFELGKVDKAAMLSGVLTRLRKAKTTAISAITAVGITSFMTNAPRSKERGAGMSNSSEKKKRYNIPLWCKPNLSIEEAAAYSGIGMGKLYEMTESQDCPFVLWIGSRRMIKRKVFDEFIERQYSI